MAAAAAEILDLQELDDDEITDSTDITQSGRGWRLERNSDGYWRWRWQLTDSDGQSVSYIAANGKRRWRRGSQYIPIRQAPQRD